MDRRLLLALWLLGFCGGALTSRAALQFDVFLGYDWIVPQASWFPVVCEIKNDGPPFVGTVELDGGRFNQEQTRRAVVELPTGTLKRFVIPVFSTTGGFGTWDVRLLDERGKVRAEQTGVAGQAADRVQHAADRRAGADAGGHAGHPAHSAAGRGIAAGGGAAAAVDLPG